MQKLGRRDVLAVFLSAIALRVVFAWEIRGDPLFSILAIDAQYYFELARAAAAGDWLWTRSGEPLWFAPLYPALLGALFRTIGPDPAWVRMLQLGLGAGTAALGAVLGGRVSRAAGWTAGLLLATCPVAIFYEGQLLYTSLAVFLTALFLERLTAAVRTRGVGGAAGAGIVLGLLGLTRSNSLLFLPVAVLLLARCAGRRPAAAIGVGTLLVLAPVFVRNGVVGDSWTSLSVNGGMIFATGFAPESVGGRALQRSPSDFGPHGAFQREAERALGRPLTLAEASRYDRDRTLRSIRDDPAGALRLTVRKLALLVTAREIDDNLGFALLRDRSRVLSWLPAPWAWLVIPAAFGAGTYLAGRAGRGRSAPDRQARQVVGILSLYVAVYSASLLLFFVNSRYRFPLAVPAAVLAGAGGEAAVRLARVRAWRRLGAAAAAAAVVGWLALRDPGVRADPALGLVAVGAALERDGRHEDALRVTERALAIDPGVAGAHQNRALSLLALGRAEEALRATEAATRLDPDLAAAWLTRGAILARSGRIEEAVPAFRHAAELQPDDPAALGNLARALAATGHPDEAIEVGRRAVAAGDRELAPRLEVWETERR
jgi:tetratricopeptide (TPR) repeat protein